jgi:hypothetical protein
MGIEIMWAKFSNAVHRQVTKATKVAGYEVAASGRTTDGSYVYNFRKTTENANVDTLRSMLISAGAFDGSWM